MCLMCESYVTSCREEECFENAGTEEYCSGMEQYVGRTLNTALWRGIGEPCEHIKSDWPDWKEYRIDLDD